MPETRFYHLQTRPKEHVLPQLLEMSMSRNWNVRLMTGNAKQVSFWDEYLWTFHEEAFLPHATDQDENLVNQPIIISNLADNQNEAHVIFLLDQAQVDNLDAYDLACRIFDGNNPDELQDARRAWKAEKESGRKLTYWQQNDMGKWVLKAET